MLRLMKMTAFAAGLVLAAALPARDKVSADIMEALLDPTSDDA